MHSLEVDDLGVLEHSRQSLASLRFDVIVLETASIQAKVFKGQKCSRGAEHKSEQ